jgi:hypothetical protein
LISELTESQRSKFSQYVSDWTQIGLCTEPLDWEEAKCAVSHAYKCADLEAPKIFIRLRSPLEGVIGAHFLSVGASVRDSVRDSVGDSVWASVGDSVWASVRASVGASVWDSVRASVWDGVRASVRASVWDSVWDQVNKAGYGQHDASWLAFCRYFRDEASLDCCRKLDGLTDTAKSCGWWWPFKGAVIITDRHNSVRRDERGRLHNSNGPSVTYPDGGVFELYAWHGLRVSKSVICDPVTIERIESEQNAEIRRVLVERFGQARYVKESNAVKVQSDDFGTLYRKDQAGDEPIFMVNVICPTTGREYMLGIDPSAYGGLAGKQAKAAVASTWRDEDTKELVFATPEEYCWESHT